jgi:polysaccharide export outer membrane protein
MKLKHVVFAVAIGLGVLLSIGGRDARAQVGNALPAAATAKLEGSASAMPDGGQPQLQRRYPRYKIQHSDVLSISFPLSPEFDQPKVMVQPDGYVNLQGAGSLHIEGMTVPEAVEAFKKAYAGTLHDPIIDVDLVDFQKPFFSVSGQVGKPGEYELRHDMTVSEAIAMAGGLAPTAKTQVFLFHRVSTDWMSVTKFNINDLMKGKNLNEDPTLSPGDMIIVPEKFITKFRKYVPYGIGTSVSTSPTYY